MTRIKKSGPTGQHPRIRTPKSDPSIGLGEVEGVAGIIFEVRKVSDGLF